MALGSAEEGEEHEKEGA